MTYATLTAMFTPAMFLLATGTFIVSTSNRMSRVIDRIRVLNEQSDALSRGVEGYDFRTERIGHIENLLAQMDVRSLIIRRALTMLYFANGTFVGTSLTLALDVQLSHRIEWVATLFAVLGATFLLLASLTLLRETRIALLLNRQEVAFYRDLRGLRLARATAQTN